MNKPFISIILGSLLLMALFAPGAYSQELLSWADCLAQAQKNHPDLISAQETVKQSQASKAITASTLFPHLDAQATAKRAKTSSSTANTFSYSGSATQLLFDGLKTINNVKTASENLKAARQKYRFTSATIRYRLRSAFINLLRAQELIQVADDIVKIRKNNLVVITLSYESGLEHKGAFLTAEANLAEAEYEQAQAKRNIEVAQRQLLKEMGAAPFSPINVAGDFSVNRGNLDKPDFDELAKEHPYLQQLAAQENAAAFSIQAAYGNFLPEVSAQAGAGQTGSHWTPNNDQWNAGLTVSLPLFEGGLRKAQVDQAKSAYRQAQEITRSARDDAVVTLEQTWAALLDAAARVDVQKKSLTAVEERSKIAEVQYSVGFISYDNWSIIADNLVQAKKAYLDAQANALLAEASWVQAKGETLEYAQ